MIAELQAELLGELPQKNEMLEEQQQRLARELNAIKAQMASMSEAQVDAQGAKDRALIEAALKQSQEAIEAARRERQRLDIARERNRQQLRSEIVARLSAIDTERKELVAFVEERGNKLAGMEKRARQLFLEVQGVENRGVAMQQQVQRDVEALRALGASEEELAAFDWAFPTTDHMLAAASRGFAQAIVGLDVKAPYFRHASLLVHLFEGVIRRAGR